MCPTTLFPLFQLMPLKNLIDLAEESRDDDQPRRRAVGALLREATPNPPETYF